MPKSVIVVGAGIAGLAVAWNLQQRGISVRVLEAGDRVGGAIQTVEQDGALLEQGPQSLRAGGAAVGRLIEGVGLVERVVGQSDAAKLRYLLHRGGLAPLPSGPLDLVKGGPVGLGTVARALLEPLVRRGPGGESIDEFVRRRFGAGVADPLLDAFIAGIYGGDATQTEAEGGFPTLVEAEREHGSVILGMMRRERAERPAWMPKGSFTFDTGVETLPKAVQAALGQRVHLGLAAHHIEADGSGFRVVHDDGADEAEMVIVAAPPHVAASLVPAWREAFEGVPAAPVAAVHLGWKAGEGPQTDGFGWLAPTRERTDCLGAIWVSSTFPHLAGGRDLIRVMLGGTRAPHLPAMSHNDLVEHAINVLSQVQGTVATPELVQVAVHQPGIPQYVIGHAARRRLLEAAVPGIIPLGWGLTGIGLTQGLDAAESVAAEIAG